jgi:uncharacterized protein (TIGR02145 family)
LKTGIYRNGNPIENVVYNGNWADLASGAWCHFENNPQLECPYGKLYNWYAVSDNRNLCPVGWHMPSDAEWTVLIDELGGLSVAGGKMKSTGTDYWQAPNVDATNESGFSALPSGGRSNYFNPFYDFRINAFWWSATRVGFSPIANKLALRYNAGDVLSGGEDIQYGYSVRCLRD